MKRARSSESASSDSPARTGPSCSTSRQGRMVPCTTCRMTATAWSPLVMCSNASGLEVLPGADVAAGHYGGDSEDREQHVELRRVHLRADDETDADRDDRDDARPPELVAARNARADVAAEEREAGA